MCRKLNLDKDLLHQKYIVERKTTRMIANECGCHATTIEHYLSTYDIKFRKTKVPKLLNQRVGHWLILEKVEKRDKRGHTVGLWRCRCDCGVELLRETRHLLRKSKCCETKHCPYSYNVLGRRTLIPGGYWSSIRGGAKKRHLKFSITRKYTYNLLLKQQYKCALSGVDICLPWGTKRSATTASLDRIDSKKGYVRGNVQWVHKKVNCMKMALTDKELISWAKKIVEHNKK